MIHCLDGGFHLLADLLSRVALLLLLLPLRVHHAVLAVPLCLRVLDLELDPGLPHLRHAVLHRREGVEDVPHPPPRQGGVAAQQHAAHPVHVQGVARLTRLRGGVVVVVMMLLLMLLL